MPLVSRVPVVRGHSTNVAALKLLTGFNEMINSEPALAVTGPVQFS
jgi:hypothetical protein